MGGTNALYVYVCVCVFAATQKPALQKRIKSNTSQREGK